MIEVQYEGPNGWGSTSYPGDAGIDLPITKQVILAPGEFEDLPSGIKVAIPEGYYGRIAARSGALRNKRIRVYEGVIDAGYRGELYSYVENVGKTATVIQPGDRLAQLIIQPIVPVGLSLVSSLPESVRGARGFGSSDGVSGNGHSASVDHPPTQREHADAILTSHGLPPLHPQQRIDGTWMPEVYIGGPIDFRDHQDRDTMITRMKSDLRITEVNWYDPRTVNDGVPDPRDIWLTNDAALNRCSLAVFLFPDPLRSGYGFGSPIEIYEMATWDDPKRPIVIWHNSDAVGAYLRKLWMEDGVIVATDWGDFIRVLGEELAKVGRG